MILKKSNLIKVFIAWMIAFSIGACIAVFSAKVYACPAYLQADRLQNLPEGKRNQLHLFTIHYRNGTRKWQSEAIQIDALDEKGLLKSTEEGVNPDHQNMEKTDRLSFYVKSFGMKFTKNDSFPCKTTQIYELQNPNSSGKFAYIAYCGQRVQKDPFYPVQHEPEKQKIWSNRFEYEYLPNNQLMYRKLVVKDPEINWRTEAAHDANMFLRLDIKKFLTLNFTNDDVVSYVENTHNGPLGMVTKIQFYLKVLAFKIQLKLATSSSFYKDSTHIPMDIEVPVQASNFLNPESGMTFDWKPGTAKFDQSNPEKTLPNANPELIKMGGKALGKLGLKYCKARQPICVFRLAGNIDDKKFKIDVNVPKDKVERGYFPMWIKDVRKFKIDMGWDDDPADPEGRFAMFFSNANLPKGTFRMEQWIRLAENAGSATCPHPVAYRRVIKATDHQAISH